jgi:hypothetical protein
LRSGWHCRKGENMECPKCDKQLMLDHVDTSDDRETYYYVCMNPRCSEYRKAFNPSSGVTVEAKIKPKK